MDECDMSQRLRQAIALNDQLLVRRILKTKPTLLRNPDYNDKSNTSLHLAAKHGLFEIAVLLIDLGHDNSVATEFYIHCNTENNQGISVNTEGYTPLHLAAASSQTPMTELLCQKFPASINRRARDGTTPLLLAAKAQSRMMLASNRPQTAKVTAHAAEDISTIEVLLEHGADVASQDQLGNTCLHHACAWGNLKAVRVLVEAGADPLCSNYAGWQPEYYSLTVQAEVYYKNLVADYEKRRAEERRLAAEGRTKNTGSVRLVTSDDNDDDDDVDDDDHGGIDSEGESQDNFSSSDRDSEEVKFHISRTRADISRSANTNGST